MATIDRYFRPKQTDLPLTNGAISKVIPSSSIKLANQMVSEVIAEDQAKKNGSKPVRGEYGFFYSR